MLLCFFQHENINYFYIFSKMNLLSSILFRALGRMAHSGKEDTERIGTEGCMDGDPVVVPKRHSAHRFNNIGGGKYVAW